MTAVCADAVANCENSTKLDFLCSGFRGLPEGTLGKLTYSVDASGQALTFRFELELENNSDRFVYEIPFIRESN